ncbi:MAG TPA: HAD-IA family hydrolase [Aquabacterium sp.]|uniref:HAD family hydrolase n=1 Tax=Aquabacterium sp. TaxID=1872578 RepID=UPI002E3255E8|nr:HAD-IA family hydrolase [Aquabacterium sp.]HEX5356922.1 HAD-IA family hydrolase [Aquabacterium sp.]
MRIDATFKPGGIHWRSPPTAVLFDLDGTLADTAGDLGGALNQLRVQRGLPPLPLDVLRPYASAGARGLIGVGLDIHPGDPEFDTLRQAFLDAYMACLADTTALFEGMSDLLYELTSRGLKWGIVTNKPHRFTLPVMDGLGLREDAAVIISGDSTAHAKPHPLPLLTACEQMDVPPASVLYVGDDLRDIQAAKAAGMPSAAAAWGYIGHNGDIGDWGADVIAAHPMDLLLHLPA